MGTKVAQEPSAACSQIVGKPYLTGLRQSCPFHSSLDCVRISVGLKVPQCTSYERVTQRFQQTIWGGPCWTAVPEQRSHTVCGRLAQYQREATLCPHTDKPGRLPRAALLSDPPRSCDGRLLSPCVCCWAENNPARRGSRKHSREYRQNASCRFRRAQVEPRPPSLRQMRDSHHRSASESPFSCSRSGGPQPTTPLSRDLRAPSRGGSKV